MIQSYIFYKRGIAIWENVFGVMVQGGLKNLRIKRHLFDEAFDKYDSMGVYCMEECRDKALDDTGYKIIKCPQCGGTGRE